ncbi:cytochrome-c oxidase, cbb3-type subunit III [Novosphingobium cyanobacteriorum]|uniref:Cbb3-type cytochrome c oxidase subunit n=1 Tax=Novosphingobium cyanobacteriorum TaxID=3024215 RepID=A0ABT6CDF2_9SPHN|nr:cytochrome-c oxidase, cbb3-type subunit III [Novosphingobium cyanobacteriorum]MDF8331579.1 cytochrome-c oxidase, cbb3-type subunit III [Novosphingobium cyanobacteriorum]
MANKRIDDATGVETVGHEWDGIEELNNPLPRWWLWTFYATVVFAVGYCVVYPAIPGLHSATAGTSGWTSRGALAMDMNAAEASRAGIRAVIDKTPVDQLANDPRLLRAAIDGGAAAFKVNCVQCHGAGAAGAKGYPNLNDDDWLWGGDIATIHQTLQHGIRQPGDDATRTSQMPAFGRDGILTAAQVQDVVSHVRVISGQEKASPSSQRGAALFAQNCVVCHGANGEGGRSVGAPRLNDAIWLYGGDRAALTETVANARYGVMPAWGSRLDPVTVKMLAAYVHARGGGEATPAPVAADAAPAAAPAAAK